MAVTAVVVAVVVIVWSAMIGVAGSAIRGAVIINSYKIHPPDGGTCICMQMKEIDSCNWCTALLSCSRLLCFNLCLCFSELLVLYYLRSVNYLIFAAIVRRI